MMDFFLSFSSTNVFAVACVSVYEGEGICFDGFGDKGRHISIHKKRSLCGHMEGVSRKLIGDRS